MTKSIAALLMLGLTVAAFLPVNENFRGPQGDDFPFSWYPMFSRPRPELEPVHYVIGLDRERKRYVIPARNYVSGGMNQSRRQLDRLASNRETAKLTCEKAARRVGANHAFSKVTELRLVRGYFNMRKYFAEGKKLPERERVIVRCKVKAPTAGIVNPSAVRRL